MDDSPTTGLMRCCKACGAAIGHFVRAPLDRLNERKDIEELKKIRLEPTRPLAEVLEELKLSGDL